MALLSSSIDIENHPSNNSELKGTTENTSFTTRFSNKNEDKKADNRFDVAELNIRPIVEVYAIDEFRSKFPDYTKNIEKYHNKRQDEIEKIKSGEKNGSYMGWEEADSALEGLANDETNE